MIPKALEDVGIFGKYLVATKDIDPIYPLLRLLLVERRLEREEAHWLVYIYLCFYNAPSAWAFYQACPNAEILRRQPAKIKTWELRHRKMLVVNIERRGLRGGLVMEALSRFAAMTAEDGISGWLRKAGLGSDPGGNFDVLWDYLRSVPWVGRWAAYKWLDLLAHVMQMPVQASDLRLKDCSGPRQALEVFQDTDELGKLEAAAVDLRTDLAAAGLALRWDELETVLCNFHSMAKGRYYIGHDIDEHLHDLKPVPDDDQAFWRTLRLNVFHSSLLGEMHGWDGVRKELKTHYQRTGLVYIPRGFRA